MKIEKREFDNFTLYYIKSNKFKTISLKTIFISDREEKDETRLKLLSNVLIRSNNNYKNEIEYSKKFIELYNPSISINTTFSNFKSFNYSISFLNEKFTEKNMNKKTIDFYYDNLFNPNVSDDSFEKTNFKLSYKVIESYYRREEENPSNKAYKRAIKNVTNDFRIKKSSNGNIDDLKEIDETNLYKYYKSLFKKSKVNVFLTGDINEDVINAISDNLKDKVFDNKEYNLKYYTPKKVDKEKEIVEIDDNNQSTLLMFYNLINLTDYERHYVLPIFNTIFGNGFDSRLFKNIREKKSLCYSINSTYYLFDDLLYIYAGISKENYENVVKYIKEEFNKIKKNITNKELNESKRIIKEDIINLNDSQNGELILYMDELIYNKKVDISKFDSVTKEDIYKLIDKFNLDLIYLLKGDK